MGIGDSPLLMREFKLTCMRNDRNINTTLGNHLSKNCCKQNAKINGQSLERNRTLTQSKVSLVRYLSIAEGKVTLQ